MNCVELAIPGAFVIESPVWGDDRGFFREWFRLPEFLAIGYDFDVAQANLSWSARNVVRGLHYSLAPEGQAKVVTCVHGQLDDVIVDVRLGSPTYGRVEIVPLGADQGRTVLLPVGVAHGVCVTGESAALAYLLSSSFDAAVELEIDPFDVELNVAWNLSGDAIVSAKDRTAPSLAQRRDAGELPLFG